MSHFATKPSADHDFREITYAKEAGTARVTINRPQHFNAYSTGALVELQAAFQDAAFDDGVGVIVFTGAGDKAFCTGGDVKEYERRYTSRPHDYWKYMRLFRAYLEAILNAGKPVIARINGMAVGGGNESQLACDLAVIAEHAFLRQVGTSVGSVACGGATQWLPLTVGDRRARQMVLLNEPVSARQALDWGLVNQVAASVTHDGRLVDGPTPEQIEAARRGSDGYGIDLGPLDLAVDAMCAQLLDKFPECTRYTRQHANFWKEFAWNQTIGHAADWLSVHYASWEPVEGMSAFVEKRRPDYSMLRRRLQEGRQASFRWGAYKAECHECGATRLPEDFRFCGECGAPLGAESPEPQARARTLVE